MRIKRRKYRTLAFAYKTAGLLWGLVHVCAVVGFLTDWTQPLLYAGIGLFSLLTVNACIGGCWRAEARADRLTRQIAEMDKQHRANRKGGCLMYYTTCPHCGAHLDPGERCDCQDHPENEDQERKEQPQHE